jgi:hypothetical protein
MRFNHIFHARDLYLNAHGWQQFPRNVDDVRGRRVSGGLYEKILADIDEPLFLKRFKMTDLRFAIFDELPPTVCIEQLDIVDVVNHGKKTENVQNTLRMSPQPIIYRQTTAPKW